MKKIYLVMLIFGVIGVVGSVIFLIYIFIKSADINSMITPLIFTFIPFAISFGLISISLKSITNKK